MSFGIVQGTRAEDRAKLTGRTRPVIGDISARQMTTDQGGMDVRLSKGSFDLKRGSGLGATVLFQESEIAATTVSQRDGKDDVISGVAP